MVLFGEYFRIGQIIALITMVFSFAIIYKLFWRRTRFRKVVLAYLFFLLSTVCALLREYVLWNTMRQVEHALLAVSSFVFLYITYYTHKNISGG
ncbi:MAG: hypothetical protein PVF58_01260 [Candidatus Methanofastidiosia archaeon]|jgi:hypothetical protein